ncbi:MAG TPA: hypothetical protein EYP39_02005 [Ghiorsea sp.]|nr:hypothetical protein [Ghiorsea sp.]HIP07342.1 hypothetical protein [Mariprofundaceae bacterium]
MNTFRARKIAEAFSPINSFGVQTTEQGVLVNYLNNHAYFETEDKFWVFAFKLAQVNHEEGQVAEIEAEFIA